MRSGQLIHRVTFKSVSTSRDAAGAPSQDLADVAEVWARVSYISGLEKWANEHVVNNYKIAILIRPRDDLKEDMRVINGTHEFDVKSIMPEPNGRRDEMIILCVDHGG